MHTPLLARRDRSPSPLAQPPTPSPSPSPNPDPGQPSGLGRCPPHSRPGTTRCIFAIIAVEFFAEFGKDGYYNSSVTDANGKTYNVQISSITARGMFYGNEYYGSFMRALYTLFQAPC